MKYQKIKSEINLETLAGGAFAEKVNEALAQVAENILDPNTEPTAKREITVKIKFTPNKNRTLVGTTISVQPKLAPSEAIETQMAMGMNMRTGGIEFAEYDGQIRGQMKLQESTQPDKEPDEAPEEDQVPQQPTGKPLDLRKRNMKPEAAPVPGRDFDPETGEVFENNQRTTTDNVVEFNTKAAQA